MRTKGYKCYNIKCGSCVGKTLCGEPADAALGCTSRMVDTMTNADRIRAMSDEELAEFLNRANGIGWDEFCKNKPECHELLSSNQMPTDEMCQACALEWLRNPGKGVG